VFLLGPPSHVVAHLGLYWRFSGYGASYDACIGPYVEVRVQIKYMNYDHMAVAAASAVPPVSCQAALRSDGQS
jgi:hypothetical protein